MDDALPDDPTSLAGTVLASSPELLDPNFRQTLIFIANHDAEGAFGLVLNRPLNKCLSDVATGPDLSKVIAQVPVYQGGPVRPEHLLVALFTQGTREDEIACHLDAPLDVTEDAIQSGKGWVRAFAGYAGWGEGQLEDELANDAWQVCTPDPTLFDPRLTAGLWPFFISEDDSWRDLLPHLPNDPSRN